MECKVCIVYIFRIFRLCTLRWQFTPSQPVEQSQMKPMSVSQAGLQVPSFLHRVPCNTVNNQTLTFLVVQISSRANLSPGR